MDEQTKEYITRIGAHIYHAWELGVIDWQTANDSLESLNVCEDLWLGMPEIPEPLDEEILYRGDLREDWSEQ
jgi:hypothetical protein